MELHDSWRVERGGWVEDHRVNEEEKGKGNVREARSRSGTVVKQRTDVSVRKEKSIIQVSLKFV